MKIAIEAQRIFRINKHGMDFVALELIRQLQQIDTTNQYFIIVKPGEDVCLQESGNLKIVEVRCPSYPLWEQVALPMALRKIKPDILHCTSNTAPVFCNVPLVLTLHDIIFLEKRAHKNSSMYQNIGFYYRKLVVPINVRKAKLVITVSDYEKSRIVDFFKKESSKIDVIKNSCGDHFAPISDYELVSRKYIDSKNYIFFMGNTDPKKNTLATLMGYAKYARTVENPLPLLLANLPEYEYRKLVNVGELCDVTDHIHLSGYIVNNDLPSIYNGATVFLYTSLRESFGIPILEAMASGSAVITSNNSAIPEVAGRDAILIDPTSVDEIADTIQRVVDDKEFRLSKIAYGHQRVKLFSWRKSAMELFNLYKTCGNVR